jgi:Zn-dependent peptidase ImmA (M78 family)
MVRRGFAAQADRLASAVRRELHLGVHDPLEPEALAAEYGVPIVSITSLVEEGARAASIRQLTNVDQGCFSAGTVLVGTTRLIVFNPAHSAGRRANSVTHELAHLLLEHAPGPAIGPGGCRVWDQEMEAEADLLAATLLVPRDAALACARAGLPHVIGAARFGVSADLMQWRTDRTGASKQARAAARQRRQTIPRLSQPDLRELLSAADLAWLHSVDSSAWHGFLRAWRNALFAQSLPRLRACLGPTTQN